MMTLLAVVALAVPSAAAGFLPSGALRWDPQPAELTAGCKAARSRAESELAALASLSPASRNFENTPWALDRVGADLGDATASDSFLKYVSVSSAVRAAANDCETLLGQFGVDMYSREDLYRALKEYAAKGDRLEGEERRLLDKQLLDFRRSGLELPAGTRKEVLTLRKKLVELESTFGRNINESKDFALFAKPQLAGVPEDFVARLEREGDKYKVGLDYPDYFPFMENALDGGARSVLEAKFNNRAYPDNLGVLKEALALRAKAAKILGYPTHAHFVLEDRMAKDPKTVTRFLERVRGRLKPLGRAELDTLKALKHVFEGPKAAREFRAWDWRFYDNQLKKSRYAIDSQRVKEYFPADHVTEQLLTLYQTLLGVRFTRVVDADVWHHAVKLYSIADAAPGSKPFAYFYMDLFPREGKYKHAAAFGMMPGRARADGSYQAPVSAMVANFDKPSKGRPSLLTHDEVETFFHEFGHIMHQTLTRARFSRFSGSSTARDFVEAPSQMLENWVWDASVLRSLSGHYRNKAHKLPQDLLDRMIAAKNVNSGLIYLRQILFGSVDMLYHTDPPADTTKAYGRLMRDVGLIPMSEGTHPEASFGHLMGYDAGYYGYLWSKVYAEDMASVFKKNGMLDTGLGRRYRTEILEKGSSRDEMESLRAFLGREPAEDAFLESIGLPPKG